MDVHSKRFVIALLAYLFSFAGLLGSLQIIVEELRSPKPYSLFTIFCVCAWLIHMSMTMAWVFDYRLPIYWVLAGAFFGFGCLVLLGPLAMVGMLFTLPCFLLALRLSFFHGRKHLLNKDALAAQ